eukprot:7386588-Prymnesium_polylepis.4
MLSALGRQRVDVVLRPSSREDLIFPSQLSTQQPQRPQRRTSNASAARRTSNTSAAISRAVSAVLPLRRSSCRVNDIPERPCLACITVSGRTSSCDCNGGQTARTTRCWPM